MNNDQLYFYNRGFNDCLAKGLNPVKELTETSYETVFDGEKYTTKLVEPKVKELTDEEILQVMINVYSDTVPPIRGVEFARAILRKASEK